MATYVHRTANGLPLNFYDHQWQIGIYASKADKLVIEKSSKVGVSEYLIARLFGEAKAGRNGMYVLPDQPVRNRFVTSRIDKAIRQTAEYNANMSKNKKDVDSKTLKTMYGREWSFIGARNPDTFYEFNSAINIYDEYDKCNILSLETATDRTLGAEKDRWIKAGNPTIEGYGIDGALNDSTYQVWMIKCGHCNEHQELDFFNQFVIQEDSNEYALRDKSIDLTQEPTADAVGYCSKCDRSIDRLGKGQWIKKYPDKLIEGFHVTRLFGSIARNRPVIIEDFKKLLDCAGDASLMQWFWNNRLGRPYAADGAKLTTALLSECVLADYLMPNITIGTPAVGGVDVGSKLHCTSSIIKDGNRVKNSIESLPLDMEALELWIKRNNIRYGVIDALPETKFTKDFVKRNRGWYRCFYGAKDDKSLALNINHKERQINVGRTETLDASLAGYSRHERFVPKNFLTIDNGDFVKQMVAPTRVYDDRRQVFVWDEGNQADHYRHADNYENIAFDLFYGAGKNVSVS